jgi:hypothetical protein
MDHRLIRADQGIVDPARLERVLPLADRALDRLAVLSAQVGHADRDLLPGLGIHEPSIAYAGRQVPLTRIEQVEDQDLVPPVAQELQREPRGLRVDQQVRQEYDQTAPSEPTGDVAQRAARLGLPARVQPDERGGDLVPVTPGRTRCDVHTYGLIEADQPNAVALAQQQERETRGELPGVPELGRQIAAALSLLLIRQGDAVGLVGFDEVIRAHIPPRGAHTHWHELLLALGRLEGSGRTEAGTALREIAGRLRRRGLVILLSDLLVDPDTTRLALRYLRHRGHEVLVLHLLDPGERELPGVGDARFVDPETGEELPVSVADLRSEYRQPLERALADWRQALDPAGISYELIETDQPMAAALRAFLRKRERLG